MTAQEQLITSKDYKPAFATNKSLARPSLLSLTFFSIKDFLNWWYVRMPMLYFTSMSRVSTVINDKLSISLLFKTYSIPWHRNKTLLGYITGFTLRTIYLPFAVLIYIFAIFTYVTLILFWLLIPLTAVTFLIITPLLRI